jgi:hypothetical protein
LEINKVHSGITYIEVQKLTQENKQLFFWGFTKSKCSGNKKLVCLFLLRWFLNMFTNFLDILHFKR